MKNDVLDVMEQFSNAVVDDAVKIFICFNLLSRCPGVTSDDFDDTVVTNQSRKGKISFISCTFTTHATQCFTLIACNREMIEVPDPSNMK